MLCSSVLWKWLSSLWTESYDHSAVTARSTICHGAFSKIKFGIQPLSYFHFNHFWKWKNYRLNEMDTDHDRPKVYRDWKIAEEHIRPVLGVR